MFREKCKCTETFHFCQWKRIRGNRREDAPKDFSLLGVHVDSLSMDKDISSASASWMYRFASRKYSPMTFHSKILCQPNWLQKVSWEEEWNWMKFPAGYPHSRQDAVGWDPDPVKSWDRQGRHDPPIIFKKEESFVMSWASHHDNFGYEHSKSCATKWWLKKMSKLDQTLTTHKLLTTKSASKSKCSV